MRLLITGAAGMLGQDLVRAAINLGHEPVGLSHSELDVLDFATVQAVVADERPEVVANCAAFTDVDGAEADPDRAHAVNGEGAGNVARAADGAGAWTIHISSDYVFDGEKRSPYLESDPPSPRSVYGASKLAGERAVTEAAAERHTIVRSSWLFGAGGRCFPQTILALADQREELTVVEDQVGCPTFTVHMAAALVAVAVAPVPGVVHLAGAGQCSWYEFAREIVRLGRRSCAINPGSSAELARPAPRPAYSVLRTERGEAVPRLPDWHDGLAQYMGAIEVPA